jgi:hypothetical protein
MAFLNGDNLKYIWYPFYPRVTWVRGKVTNGKPAITKKNIIPIGVHDLEIKHVKDVKTKKGTRKVELYIYCPPYQIYDYDNDTCSFDYIVCTHVKSYRPQGKLNSEWYKIWSMCLSDSDLDKMLTWEKKKFRAVIAHVQENVKVNGVNKINEFGEEVVFWQPKIISVHKLTEEVKVDDYFKLFKPVRYDPIEELRSEKHIQLFFRNTDAVTGGAKEELIPF